MFSFEPYERHLYYRSDFTSITEHIEQRFVLHFGDEKLNNRFFVVLDQGIVRFFYYDEKYEENAELTIESAQNADLLRELGCVSLNNPKDMGNDILSFPQMACGKIENLPPEKESTKVLEAFKEIFYGFPFWNEIQKKEKKENADENADKNAEENAEEKTKETSNQKDQKKEEEQRNKFKTIAKCCFLSFILGIEKPDGNLTNSQLYEHVKNQLQQSDVYRLLSAKLLYVLYLPKNGISYNSKKYSKIAGKYADRLMDKRINKVISPHNYPPRNKQKQLWFYNPEEELEALLEQNRRQSLSSQSASKALLDDGLVLKIRDFLYAKHAVYQAATSLISKRFFSFGQILMAITIFSILIAFLQPMWFDIIVKRCFPLTIFLFCLIFSFYLSWSDWKRRKKSFIKIRSYLRAKQVCGIIPIITLLFITAFTLTKGKSIPILYTGCYFAVIVSILLSVVASGYFNNAGPKLRGGISYALFPRILVAELAAWLTIGIAEDLVKSMLWVDSWLNTLLAFGVILLLIGSIIYGEVKQHSPYLGAGDVFKRLFPILNHSLFFALFFGVIAQGIFYSNLIKNSDVMPNVVFSNYFAEANYYCQNLVDLDNAIRRYETYCHTSSLKDFSVEGKGSGTQITISNDSIPNSTTVKLKQQFQTKVLMGKEEIHYSLVQHIDGILYELHSLWRAKGINYYLTNDTLSRLPGLALMADNLRRKYIQRNLDILNPLPFFLQKEITSVRRNTMKFNDYNILIDWTTAGKQHSVNTGSDYLNRLTSEYQNKYKCSRLLPVTQELHIRIFPILLIFHTLIVLVIAFVTQLIFTDKTVTETV